MEHNQSSNSNRTNRNSNRNRNNMPSEVMNKIHKPTLNYGFNPLLRIRWSEQIKYYDDGGVACSRVTSL